MGLYSQSSMKQQRQGSESVQCCLVDEPTLPHLAVTLFTGNDPKVNWCVV